MLSRAKHHTTKKTRSLNNKNNTNHIHSKHSKPSSLHKQISKRLLSTTNNDQSKNQHEQQLKLTLFTPTVSIADRLDIKLCRFPLLNEQTHSIYPLNPVASNNNTANTFQIAPGLLFFVEKLSHYNQPILQNQQSTITNLEESEVTISSNTTTSIDTTLNTHPLSQSTVQTPVETLARGLKYHLYYISGGIGVRHKKDFIISAVQLINPLHLDPIKIKSLLEHTTQNSSKVIDIYDTLRQINPQLSMQYGLYDDNAYITSIMNDVALSLDSTIKHLEKHDVIPTQHI